jgi:ribose transport system permease protein
MFHMSGTPEVALPSPGTGRARSDRDMGIAWKAAMATLLLVTLGGITEPATISYSAFLAMLPFMAILGVASVGQLLVVQQRGLDISVAGMVSLAAVIVTVVPNPSDNPLAVAGGVLLALLAGVVAGAVNGFAVTLLRVPSLVTTIGTNSVLLGFVLYASNGTPTQGAASLTHLVVGRTVGLPNTLLIMLVISVLATLVIARTKLGRRYIAAGMSERASYALGIPVNTYRIATYAVAGFCYALSGVLLAGLFTVPDIFCGDGYMLSTVAAVVVAGNSLTGGRCSIPATVVGAIFLTYLDQLVLSLGFATSAQYIIHALVVILGVAVPNLLGHRKVAG